jgi:hypothetical protein
MRIIATILLVCFSNFVFGQSVDEIKNSFPGEQAAFKNHSVHYIFKLKDGEPYAESKEVQEMLFLSNNAVYLSRFGFYQSSFDTIDDYEAYTITPEGKKIAVKEFKTTANRSRSVFYDDIKETSFDFPSVTTGSIGHLEYRSVHKNLRLLSPHYFSHGIPMVNGELKITFPKEMTIKYQVMGNQKEKVQFTSEIGRKETTYTFRVNNLEKDQDYADAPDNSYYALHVIFYIESIIDQKGQMVKWLGTTDDLYRFYRGFINNINKEISPELKKITDSLIQNASTDEAKARRIYKWVQQNIKYVAFENGMEGFIPRDASLVCSRRYGDCKDMASILTKMLQYSGVEACFVWIGTRSLPYEYTAVPLPIVDNHMISAVKLDTGYVFLDGTDSHCVFGIPSGHIQGKQALLGLNEKEYKIVRVPIVEKEKNVYADTTFLRLTDKGIQGTIRIGMTGYFAMDMYSAMNQTNDKSKEKLINNFLSRGSNKFKVNNYEVIDTGDPNKYYINGEFELEGSDKKIGDDWFLNLNLQKLFEHQEIDYPRRKLPVEFDYKNERQYVTILEIPEGYNLSYKPESKSYKNEAWGFDLSYEEKKNQVILTQHFENNQLLLPVEKFQAWNKVLENLLPAYKETISLSKK